MPFSGVQTCALDRKSTRLNSSHTIISYAVFCLKKQKFGMLDALAGEEDPAPAQRRAPAHNQVFPTVWPVVTPSLPALRSWSLFLFFWRGRPPRLPPPPPPRGPPRP